MTGRGCIDLYRSVAPTHTILYVLNRGHIHGQRSLRSIHRLCSRGSHASSQHEKGWVGHSSKHSRSSWSKRSTALKNDSNVAGPPKIEGDQRLRRNDPRGDSRECDFLGDPLAGTPRIDVLPEGTVAILETIRALDGSLTRVFVVQHDEAARTACHQSSSALPANVLGEERRSGARVGRPRATPPRR